MTSAFKDGCEPEMKLKAFCESRTVNADGSWSPKDHSWGDRWASILASYLVEDRHPIERVMAVSRILNKKQNWNFNEFSSAYRAALVELDKEKARYIVVFPMAGKVDLLGSIKSAEGRDFKVVKPPHTKTEARIEKLRAQQRESRDYSELFEGIMRYTSGVQIHVRVSAVSAFHAQSLAREKIDEVLGALNLAANWSKFRFTSPLQLPVSEILIAPQTTVHHLNGSLELNRFWFESWIGAPYGTSIREAESVIIVKNFNDTRRDVLKSKWREECKQALRLFFQFTMEPDVKVAFLLGWQLLEFLVSGKKTSYDVVVSRASRFYIDFQFAKVGGTYFKDVRNYLSHGQTQSSMMIARYCIASKSISVQS